MIEILLKDQTTGKNIIWANNTEHEKEEITVEDIYSIEPRREKNRELQKLRTKVRAEIFTPPDICAKQNNLIEADKKSWQDYIDAKYLEITCGEAPYLVSRYNAVTGEPIPFDDRHGLLDRKLKFIKEQKLKPIIDCTRRAVQSIYGYEFQGDNLFLARRNIFDTVAEFVYDKAPAKELKNFLSEVAEIISWNLWQMDGRTNKIPYANTNLQSSFNFYGEKTEPQGEIFCKIMDWKNKQPKTFKSLLGGG
ncbi:MAG: hypothetical protein IKO74_08325 [Selenomonadaceae bacterium]|nr:hypothetical protein [Selenomonadaceae bacterium]